MGKQINFAMDEETEERLFEFIKEKGKALFRTRNVENNETNSLKYKETDMLPKKNELYWSTLYLCENLEDVYIETLEGGNERIFGITEPIIEFSRTFVNEESKKVKKGRFWVEMKYYDKNGNYVSKNESLDIWYKSLRKWVKKNAPYTEITQDGSTDKHYITKEMLKFADEGYRIY